MNIKAIIGLGNPGLKYVHTRHNIGFKIVDALAEKYHGVWRSKGNAEIADIILGNHSIILIKPQTFMNSSGEVVPALLKQGIKAENILVAHDELELPFGTVKIKVGGSSRGHNGLKSIIAACGDLFPRVRFGIARPEDKQEVPDYVLKPFSESADEIKKRIAETVRVIEELIVQGC